MSTLGKSLVVLNVLAAIAFFCLAAADWGKRQAWSYSVLRHDLLINGLPLDENDTRPDGVRMVDLLGQNTLNQVFQQAGGQPVSTQVAEVQRRIPPLRSEIEGQPNDPAKKQRLEQIVLPLLRTGGERDAVREQIRTGKIEELMGPGGPFEAAFQSAQNTQLEASQRRQAIAHVLFNVSEQPADQQRAVVVCGLEAYDREVDSQAAALRDMVERQEHLIAADRAAFEATYKQLFARLELQAERVAQAQKALQHQRDLVAQHQVLVNARKTDVMNLSADLEKAKQDAAVALKGQEKMERELFAADQAAGTAKDATVRLEQQIRSRELGR